MHQGQMTSTMNETNKKLARLISSTQVTSAVTGIGGSLGRVVTIAINLQEPDEPGDPNILIIDGTRSPLEDLSAWIASTLVYSMMLMSGVLMFLSIKRGRLAAHHMNLLFNLVCLVSSVVSTLTVIILEEEDILIAMNSFAGFLALAAVVQTLRVRTQIRRYAALIQLRQEVLALRQEEEPRNPEQQEPQQLPHAVPDLIPATFDLPTADEEKVPTTSSNTGGKLKDGEM